MCNKCAGKDVERTPEAIAAQKEAEEERIQEELKDPLVQAKLRELDIKEKDVDRKTQADVMKQEATTERELRKDQLEVQKIRSQEKIAGAKIGADIMETIVDAQIADKELSAKQQAKGALYISCLGRGKNLFGENSEELTMINDVLGDIPTAGFYANGEIAGDQLYGYTGVLTIFL